MMYSNGDEYNGEWVDGLKHGRGKFVSKTQNISGVWKNGKLTELINWWKYIILFIHKDKFNWFYIQIISLLIKSMPTNKNVQFLSFRNIFSK